MDITWEDLKVSVATTGGKSKPILKGLTGHARAGRMLAVMGATGGGATQVPSSAPFFLRSVLTFTARLNRQDHPPHQSRRQR